MALKQLEKGGLKVTTTLDYTLQEIGEKITKEGALENEKTMNGKNACSCGNKPKNRTDFNNDRFKRLF